MVLVFQGWDWDGGEPLRELKKREGGNSLLLWGPAAWVKPSPFNPPRGAPPPTFSPIDGGFEVAGGGAAGGDDGKAWNFFAGPGPFRKNSRQFFDGYGSLYNPVITITWTRAL